MKIFYTKKDRELVEALLQENGSLREIISKKEYTYLRSKEKFEKLYNETLKVNEQHQKIIENTYAKIDELKRKLRQYYGRNGGLTKYNNRLKREIEELKGN